MNLSKTTVAALALYLFGISTPAALAADGNWKLGRIYYRMVCTVCHKSAEGGGKAINPSSMTIAEWEAYFAADKHAKGKDSLKYYVSREYREKIKDSNKAARKLLNVPDDKLLADVLAFVRHGAKDSPTPARCN